MFLYILFATFLSSLSFIQSGKRILPEKSKRDWRCPGEECDIKNVCLGSTCKCNESKICYCKMSENKYFSYKSWDENTNICTGYLDINEECEHGKFCISRSCVNMSGKKICIENKRDLQRNGGPQNNNPKSDNTSPKYPSPNTSLNTLNTVKCKISMDCKSTQACYEGICVNWGSQCIGQKECEKGCCEGGYCQRDDTVCNKYFSALTVMIISWIIFGFGFLNCLFWIIWYFVGRSKIISLTTVTAVNIPNKNFVQGLPITTSNIIQANNIGQKVNNVTKNNSNKNVVLAKNNPDKISNNYQNINNPNVHFE